MQAILLQTVRALGRGSGALILVGLAACGGGLGSEDDDDSISIDSVVQSSQTVNCKSAAYATATIGYAGEISSGDLTYSWTQTAGTSVALVGTTGNTVYFTAPSSAGTVVLKLTVSARNVSDSASVSFTIAGNTCTSS